MSKICNPVLKRWAAEKVFHKRDQAMVVVGPGLDRGMEPTTFWGG